MTMVSAVYDSNGIAEATVDYYMPQDDFFTIEVLTGDGLTGIVEKANATVVEYPQVGRVRVRAKVALPPNRRGFPTRIRVGQATSGATATQNAVVWAAAASFGTNPNASVYYYLNSPTSNKNTGEWRNTVFAGNETQPAIDATGTPVAAEFANGKRPAMLLPPPAVVGQRTRIQVTGSMTGVRFEGGGNVSATNPSQVQSASGESWLDFDWNWNQLEYYSGNWSAPGRGGPDEFLLYAQPLGDSAYTNCRVYEINPDGSRRSPTYWDKDHIEINSRYSKFLFGLRFMDMMNTVGTAHITNTRITQSGDIGQAITHSVPDLLDLLTLTGCTGRFHVPLRATEAWIRTEARRTAVWARQRNKPVMWTLSNEIWNPGQPAWQNISPQNNGLAVEAENAGYYTVDPGATHHDRVMRYWSYRHKQVMSMIMEEFVAEGVQHLLVCNIDLQNDSPGNNQPVCEGEPGIAPYIQSLSTAPYIGGGKGIGLGITDTAAVAAQIRGDIPNSYGKAAQTRDYATSKGWAFFEYEGAFENIENLVLWHNLMASQDGYNLLKYMISEHKRIVGGQQTFYTDYRPAAWGLTHHVAHTATAPVQRPSMFAKAWYEEMAAAAAVIS